MILRSFFLLGVGAVIACAAPAFAAGTTAPTTQTETQTASAATASPDVAALQATTPKADAPVVKKSKAKSAARKTTRKIAKAKKPATDVAIDKDKGGFFSRLFGGGIKNKSQADARSADAKVKAKPVKLTVKPKEQLRPVEDDPTLPQITGNDGELRSEADQQRPSLFASLFGGSVVAPRMLPETRALDRVL